MKKSLIAFGELLVSDEELSESVEPGMSRLHDPTPVLWRTSTSALLSCNPWHVAPDTNLLSDRFAIISLIRIQETLFPLRKGNNDGIEHRGELTCVMSMGPGDDQRQRDATCVHQKMAFASLFSPGPSDLDPLLPSPEAL